MKRILQIFREGHQQTTPLVEPLATGEQGNKQTLSVMIDIVRTDRTQPDLRAFVLREIVGKVDPHNFGGEADAAFKFAQSHITFRKDPVDVERVADMWSTLYAINKDNPEGDCGIKSTFLATCLALLGHKPFFVIIKQLPNQKGFNHIYNAAEISGSLRYFDATPEQTPAGWEAPSVEKKLIPIF